jgi:polyisoprenoid-binding protein YceI
MIQLLQRRRGRIAALVAGLVALVVVAAIVVIFALFGGIGSATGGSAGKGSSGGVAAVPTLAPTKSGTIFTIDASSSQATFTIHEVLFGQPNTVVGKTTSVAGQMLVNRQDPSQSQLGEIKVDLSTLATDNDLRNRTLQSRILETSDPSNQYATFVATALKGLPSSVTIGQPVSFSITGNLTLHGVTRAVTFVAQVTEQSATKLTGQAQATVRYADFGIAIPQVPSATDVGDTVVLALTFTASA